VNLKHLSLTAALRGLILFSLVAFLGACAGLDKPKPAELGPNPASIGVRQVWSAKVGAVGLPLDINVSGTSISVASSDGSVAVIDARTGKDVWRTNIGTPIAAGVGSDGKYVAVVTRTNELVALEAGRELWRQKIGSVSFTAPLVAGERIFVLSADRIVSAFDARSGRKLWGQSRPGEPLVLRQAGVIMAVGDTLVVGLSGRLVGMNPLNGSTRWEASLAVSRGTNEVERLVDLVARVSREGDVVCARSFQTAVACVNAARGTVLWNKPASGSEGLQGDDRFVYGTESDGKVIAWRRADGERAWVTEKLKFRGLSAPLVVGRSVAVGDETGLLHFLSREDGSVLNRVTADGTAIAVAPVLAGDTLVVVTSSGGIFGFKVE
jgi:outer membrane protein assembly factor BamB